MKKLFLSLAVAILFASCSVSEKESTEVIDSTKVDSVAVGTVLTVDSAKTDSVK